MKEYTYTNKAYLGIKEGIVPPAPQYLWLNSKDDRLYKFGDNGWEVTNNAPYIVEEFTIRDIQSQSTEPNPKLAISRDFLDAMYKGVPIMIKTGFEEATLPVIVYVMRDPSSLTRFIFDVTNEGITYRVISANTDVITGNKTMGVSIIKYNSIDWNSNKYTTGYIANRTHHLGDMIGPIQVGQRVSLTYHKGAHYIGNYKLLYDGKFYDLPTATQTQVNISNYFKMIFNGYGESGNTSTYTLTSQQTSQTLPSQTFVICRDIESEGHKTLDEFFLPDGAKPWKFIPATLHKTEGVYIFKDVSTADIANGENVLRNKVIYQVDNNPVNIHLYYNMPILEFKILAGPRATITFSGKYTWENGALPDTTNASEVLYSVLIFGAKAYVSAKVYRMI